MGRCSLRLALSTKQGVSFVVDLPRSFPNLSESLRTMSMVTIRLSYTERALFVLSRSAVG